MLTPDANQIPTRDDATQRRSTESDSDASSFSDGEADYTSLVVMGLFPEIWDDILDYLWDEPKTLLACSLTCRDWKRKCGKMIREGSNVSLITKEDVAALAASLDRSPAWARVIDRLLVGEVTRVRGTPLLLFSIVSTQLPGRFRGTNHLRLIVNGRMDASKSPPASLSLCGTFHDSIVYLDLQDITFTSFADLTRLLLSFPRLHTLRLKQLNWNQYRLTPAMSKNPRLKNLKIQNMEVAAGHVTYPIGQFIDWFVTTPSVDSLRSLDLFEESAGIEVYYTLIRRCDRSLHELRVCFSPGLTKYLPILSRRCPRCLISTQPADGNAYRHIIPVSFPEPSHNGTSGTSVH